MTLLNKDEVRTLTRQMLQPNRGHQHSLICFTV